MIKNILIPISLWDTTDKVVGQGVQIAEAFNATIWLLHVVKIPSHMSRWPDELKGQRAKELQALHQELQSRAKKIIARGLKANAMVKESSGAVVAILEEAEQCKADIIVMGSHGKGALVGAILGDVTGDVLRRAPCPVLVIPMTKHKTEDETLNELLLI